MYVAVVPNRGSAPAILLRESYRDGTKVKNRTLQNLSNWPAERIELLRAVLRGDRLVPAGEGLEIIRALPHGHVLATLGTARRLKLDRLLPRALDRRVQLALGLIVARVLEPASKLATARGLDETTAINSLGVTLGLGAVKAKEVYDTLDWLGASQATIEQGLAQRHLANGVLVLYDVTSTWLEGRCCELARLGYRRDGRRDKLQIIVGLLCAADGCPIAVEVFEGNTGDPSTLAKQVTKLKHRFGLHHVVLVGDRGMITAARIENDLAPAGLDWLTALRAPAVQALAADQGPLQLSLFDHRDMAEIDSADFPGERLIVCRNPLLAAERARQRAELLDATELDLRKIQLRVRRARKPLHGADRIGLAVGAVMGRRKMAKHFKIDITDSDLDFIRLHDAIAQESALDGIYVLRTNVPKHSLDTAGVIKAYKSLSRVERAFRCLKTVDLELRPVFHWTAPRVRAHVLLCMLAYYIEWHMRQALAPILFDDHDRIAADAQRPSPVAKAEPSPAAKRKAATKRTHDGLTVRSFRDLLNDLATLTRNTVRLARGASFPLLATPTKIQIRALELLAVKPTL